MLRETFPVPPLGCNCTILGDAGEALVIDPGGDIPCIISTLAEHQLNVVAIVITHAHIDHIASALSLKEITGAPICLNQKDLPLLAIMDVQAGWLGIEPPKVQNPDVDAANLLKLRSETKKQPSFIPPATPRAASQFISLKTCYLSPAIPSLTAP